MKIGIIGAGNVGGGLGKVWARLGHEVVYGVRDPQSDKLKAVLAESPHARAASIREAAAFGDIVALATPWAAAEEAVREAGDLSGKLLIDCINPVGFSLPTSAAEMVAGWAHGAKVVKAFNTIGANNYSDLQFSGLRADAYICGDDAEVKKVVGQLAESMGFDVVDAGPLSNAHLLEELTILWVTLARQGYGREIAFKLLRK